jgi:hypothetical protein
VVTRLGSRKRPVSWGYKAAAGGSVEWNAVDVLLHRLLLMPHRGGRTRPVIWMAM